jgi:hypothetical protein
MKVFGFLLIALMAIVPVCADDVDRTTTIEEIRVQVSQASDIDYFVRWLKERTNVSDVDSKPVLLTTAPPQQWISFLIDGKKYRFRLMREKDVEIRSVTGSDRRVVKGKVVIMGEDAPPVKR